MSYESVKKIAAAGIDTYLAIYVLTQSVGRARESRVTLPLEVVVKETFYPHS